MSWWGRFTRRTALDRDLDRELSDHLERRVRALVEQGVSASEARRVARLEIGGVEQGKEAVRDVRGTRWAHDFVQDVRYGVRTLRKSPGLLAAAVLSMGLGIGANAAIFSHVDAVLLRALPVRDPASLVVVGQRSWTNPIWEAIRDRSPAFSAGALAFSDERFDLSRGGETDPVNGLWVSGSFFDVLGVRPAAGRLLASADDRRGGGPDGPVVVLGHGFWQRRFGGDPAAIGRPLVIRGVPFTIVGVAPARFLGPQVGTPFDVAAPLASVDLVNQGGQQSQLDGRSTWWLTILLRMQPGQTPEALTAALRGIQPQVREATLPDWPPPMLKRYLATPLTVAPAATGVSELRQHYREPLLVMMAIVGVLLLVACANVANLLLARAAARRHELSARLALGASRSRLMRQLLTESLVLAVPGALAGLALAIWGSRLLAAQLVTSETPVALELPVDWRLLGFLTVVTVGTAILFGLAPAWRTRRLSAADAMVQSTHGRVTRGGVLSAPLVVGQVALSLVLAVAAGLFGRTLSALTTRDLGFEPEGIHQAFIEAGRVPAGERVALYQRLREAALRVPGVTAAAASMMEPMSGMGWNSSVQVPGTPQRTGPESMTYLNAVTPGWFATYGTAMRAGRDFDTRDAGGGPVGIVNETFARQFLPGPSVVGRRVTLETGPGTFTEIEIVGVVETAAYRNVREPFPPTLYRPAAQMTGEGPPFLTLTVRTRPGGALGLRVPLTEAIRGVDPGLAITYRTLSARLHDQLVETRTIARLSAVFGVLALILAAIGLYGVTSYGVNERKREIGIRLTLGAGRAAAERLVLRRVARFVAIGVALGIGVSLALAPLVRTQLYALEPRDPVTIATAAIVLAIVGLLAGWLPARRAARIDPAQVLREG